MAIVTEAVYVLICILLVSFVFKAEAQEVKPLPSASTQHAVLQHTCSSS